MYIVDTANISVSVLASIGEFHGKVSGIDIGNKSPMLLILFHINLYYIPFYDSLMTEKLSLLLLKMQLYLKLELIPNDETPLRW